ncbi:MAG: hypothetical protein Q8O00_09445 [Holophaga sp.]|nr:hypothetical protein [Holophaga sp.]
MIYNSFFVIPLLSLSLLAQTPKPSEKTSPVATPAAAGEAIPSQEDVIRVKITPYRPSLVREPFSAPSDMEQANKGDLVDDIGVKGWLKDKGVAYAVVSDSRGITKRLPIGYRFRDGELVSIDEKSVTFHQWDISSTNRSVFRTVVKTFKREEGKR